jgi:4'-phosphopantetheinyl transferase
VPSVSTALVRVRWLRTDDVTPEAREALALLLDDEERARAARFHFERDRHVFIIAHAFVRALLSAEAPRPIQDWRFSAGDFGKPEVIRDAETPPLRFNLSHTRGLVAVALTLANDVGIDVEALDPGRLSMDLAQSTFAPAEVAMLRATQEAELTDALYAVWTLKEACIKAIGKGLQQPLDSFAVTLDPLAVRFTEAAGDVPARWLLRRMRPTSEHTLALALSHPDSASVGIDAAGLDAGDFVQRVREAGSGKMVRM